MAAFNPETFAVAVLRGLRAPRTRGNVRALVGWERAEGGHWHNDARFNPLNTTQPAPGAGNTGSQGNIKVYRSPQQGVNATVRTLRNGRYGGILAALARGNDPGGVARAVGASPWGTSASLVASAISGTPAPKGIPKGVIGGDAAGGGALLDSSTTRTAGPQGSALALLQALSEQQGPQQAPSVGLAPPSFSARPALPQTYQAPASGGGPAPKPDLSALLAAVQTSGDTGSSSTTTDVIGGGAGGGGAGGAPAAAAPKAAGVAKFEGKPVAAWIAPALSYARQHGWKGTVNSGYRSFADQTRIYNSGVRPAARPGTSNHEGTKFPRGAVDVSDAATLSRILRGSRYGHLLVWAGAKDPVHFSHPHNGSY